MKYLEGKDVSVYIRPDWLARGSLISLLISISFAAKDEGMFGTRPNCRPCVEGY